MKDSTPLTMLFYQSDIEKIMYQLNQIINNDKVDKKQLILIKDDIQHKIDWHKEHGEWI